MKNVMNVLNLKILNGAIIMSRLRQSLRSYLKDEDGAGVIELVLILVVLIGLVLVFKDKIGVLLNNIFRNINSSADAIYNS